MKVKTKKPTHGGARKGSGRRALGKVVMLLRVNPETRKSIQGEAVAAGVTLGAVVDDKFASEKH